MNRKLLMTLAVAVSIAMFAFVAACGDGDDDGNGGDGGAVTKVDVELNEWKVIPSVSSVNAGKVEFVAKNTGKAEHEIVIIKTGLAADKLPVSGGRVDEAKAGEEIGEIEEFDPGKTEKGTFDLKAGKYALICNVAGHYEQGMYVPFEVK